MAITQVRDPEDLDQGGLDVWKMVRLWIHFHSERNREVKENKACACSYDGETGRSWILERRWGVRVMNVLGGESGIQGRQLG